MTKLIAVQCPQSKKNNHNKQTINKLHGQGVQAFPSTRQYYLVPDYFSTPLQWSSNDMPQFSEESAEIHNSTSSFAGKAGELHLYELSSEISTKASKTTSQCVTAVYLQGSAS